MTVRVAEPADLDAKAVAAVAAGAHVVLADGLLARLDVSRAATLAALDGSVPVYGVSTGMGLQSSLAVGTADQPSYQSDLMLARSVGGPPWLDRPATRAVLATRLRTLLEPEAGASPDLARALVAVLDAGLHPAVPATGNGAAGEIIPLAHLGAFLTGAGDGVRRDGSEAPAATLLSEAGLAPYPLAAKEGVAFLQGVPVAAARAVLLGREARLLAGQSLVAAAGGLVLVRAPRDPYDGALARGDDLLASVLRAVRELVGDEDEPRMLQAPVSMRLLGPTVTHLLRTTGHLEEAVERALSGISTSPALVGGRFLGTAGFDGFELAAGLDAVRLAALHAAEVATARLHRLLDPRVSGLAAQLSQTPGRQAGLVAVHKRAVGLLHDVRRSAAPASAGAVETSLGQEDVQSFGLEAAAALEQCLDVLRDVTACELLAVHQGRLLSGGARQGSDRLESLLRQGFVDLPGETGDRLWGRDVQGLKHGLRAGWAHDALDAAGARADRDAREWSRGR